jgi:hypothetical protein
MSAFEMVNAWHGAEVLATVKAMADEGAKLAAEHLKTKSQEVVPYLSGALHNSCAVNRVEEGEYAVSYDTPYAVAVHENLARFHPHGKIAKYLERPMLEEAHVMFLLLGGKVHLK